MTSVQRDFHRRLSRIPSLGLGLSVDVYTPDLFEVLHALEMHDLTCGYLEIFKATTAALKEVRRRAPDRHFAYHAEGLWLTQPDWDIHYPVQQEVGTAAEHLSLLGSYWMNHECATKHMAGYAFGTYVPPLFTADSADVVAAHARYLQQALAASGFFRLGEDPLLLLEVPPLTYFGLGDLSVPAYFSRLVEQAPCGLVLDVGHLWTIYRYTGAWRRQSLSTFLADFLDRFPLSRVVQLHVAGLDTHETITAEDGSDDPGTPPLWIDSHAAPIPPVLFDMLDRILAHPGLTALRGVALEVDTKAIPLIVAEYSDVVEQFGSMIDEACVPNAATQIAPMDDDGPDATDRATIAELTSTSREVLLAQYTAYAELAAGRTQEVPAALASAGFDPTGVSLYRRSYLPHEILQWGGDVRAMFPLTWRRLDAAGIAPAAFVEFWLGYPRPADEPYDFFLLKLDRFCGFVSTVLPEAAPLAEQEAGELRHAYRAACADLIDTEPARA